MKKVYDKQGEFKGILRSIDEIKDDWQFRTFEAFVRAGCIIYEHEPGRYGAIPGTSCDIVEAGR